MKHTKHNSRQRGAALITGLVLLAVITLLAVVGMNISNAELASATSEQLRLRAFQAAETGLEHGLVEMGGACGGAEGEEFKDDPVGVEGSPTDEDDNPIDTYTLGFTPRGEGSAPGYGVNFASFHCSIQSEGGSARDTKALNEVGAYVMNGRSNTATFTALPE